MTNHEVKKAEVSKTVSVYDAETDSEDEIAPGPSFNTKQESPVKTTSSIPAKLDFDNLDEVELPPLPDFFKRKKFLLFGNFDSDARRLLKRFIIAYNG